MAPKRFILEQANYRQLLDYQPTVAVLPWGATEAHNYHLPHGTDVIEARSLAERAAKRAHDRGARPIVLPTVPFGNNAQQLDQVVTISIGTGTAAAILRDVARSLKAQELDRLVILNAHGGNEFRPLVRDLMTDTGVFMVVVNFWQLVPEMLESVFDDPGDHAGELETSLMLHLCPELVELSQAGNGTRVPMRLRRLSQPGVWTPRPWSKVHPDTGSGDPSTGTADKGCRYVEAVAATLEELIIELSAAKKGELPYV